MTKMTKAELIEMVKHHEEGTGLITAARGLRILLLFKGSWNPQGLYTFFDLVEYQNEVYVSKKHEKGIEPGTDSEAWITFDEFDNFCHKGENEEETKCK